LEQTAPAFVQMAHSIVWASVATVDADSKPRSRILHPLWEWDGTDLFGWVATVPSPVKRAHLAVHPYVSVNYWSAANHDTCSAECLVEWYLDDDTCATVWDKFANAPAPVGYDPTISPGWDAPTSPAFAVLRLTPYRLRVMPGTVLTAGQGETLNWHG
jgi:hypothetical protein